MALTLATGIEESRGDGAATIEGIRRIKAELPGVSTILGLSNVSFGLKPAARHVLNSVFLHECVQAGLDAAIVHAAHHAAEPKIDEHQREVALDLIYDRRRDGYDPLQELLALFEGVDTSTVEKEDRSGWPVDERLKQRIIDGDRDGLEADLDRRWPWPTGSPRSSIVNDVLLDGMKVVGELFGSGQMQLPFVLQSAETMKAAVAYLEPHMEKADQGGKGRIVLATVKGDVHDIGKNLVDIILTNNGYEVYNLGIKVAITEMIDKALEVEADAIGMSGLLVKSTLIMRENLEELNERGLADLPVLLGGAALTRTYVERDLREVYDGRLFYGKDAFEGLHTMDRLMTLKKGAGLDSDPDFGIAPAECCRPAAKVAVDLSTLRALARGRDRQPGVRAAVRRLAGGQGHRPRRHRRVRQRDGALPQPVGLPSGRRRGRRRVQDRIRPALREQLAQAKASGVLVPQVVYGYFAANGDGNDVVIWKDESRTAEWMRFPFPRARRSRRSCASPTSSGPSTPGEVDYAAFHIVTMGARLRGDGQAVRRRPLPGLPAPARARRRDGRGAGRALAPAHPRGVGLRRRGRPDARRPVPPAVPGRPLLVGLPRLPRPGGQRQGGRAARGRPHRRRGRRGLPVPPRADDLRHHLPPPARPSTSSLEVSRPNSHASARGRGGGWATRSVPKAVRMAR